MIGHEENRAFLCKQAFDGWQFGGIFDLLVGTENEPKNIGRKGQPVGRVLDTCQWTCIGEPVRVVKQGDADAGEPSEYVLEVGGEQVPLTVSDIAKGVPPVAGEAVTRATSQAAAEKPAAESSASDEVPTDVNYGNGHTAACFMIGKKWIDS